MRFKINNDRGWGPKTATTRNSSTESCVTENRENSHTNSRTTGRSNGRILRSPDDEPQQPLERPKAGLK